MRVCVYMCTAWFEGERELQSACTDELISVDRLFVRVADATLHLALQ